MEFKVYILYSFDWQKYYIGQTNNLSLRLDQHNKTGNGYTSKFRPWRLVYEETFDNRIEAVKLENYLKSLKNKDRIRQYIAGWRSKSLPPK